MFLYQSFTSDEQCEKNDNVQNCRNKHGLLIFVSSIVIEDDNDYLGWINCTMHA